MDASMAEVIEGHIRFHVLNPGRNVTAEQQQAADDLVGALRAYLQQPVRDCWSDRRLICLPVGWLPIATASPHLPDGKVKVIIGVLAAILFIDLCSLWFQSAVTSVAAVPEVKTIGAKTPVEVQATNPHGVRRVTAWLEQGGSRFRVFRQESPAHFWRWKRDQPPTRVRFDTGKEKVPELREGRARLLVEAVGDDFHGASATSTYEVDIKPSQN